MKVEIDFGAAIFGPQMEAKSDWNLSKKRFVAS